MCGKQDKYNLTYGKGKEKVKREKLDNPDKVKYYIYDTIKAVLPYCKTPADLRFSLQESGIEIDYKLRRTTNEIEGVSFRYNDIAFKGSNIDRRFSFGNLKKEFERNIRILQEQTAKTQEQQEKQSPKVQQQAEIKPKNPTIGGVELNSEQWQSLQEGGFIYLENMKKKDGSKLSAYLFFDSQMKQHFLTKQNPESFVKYGQYEMRLMDKMKIEAGFITKAKVKWYGGGFAYPYLWKTNKADTEYKESWGDPRIPKTQKIEKKPQSSTIQKKNSRGRSI